MQIAFKAIHDNSPSTVNQSSAPSPARASRRETKRRMTATISRPVKTAATVTSWYPISSARYSGGKVGGDCPADMAPKTELNRIWGQAPLSGTKGNELTETKMKDSVEKDVE